MQDELWRWQACDLARAIRTRRITAREAITSCLARLGEINPHINAVVDLTADEALAAADAADATVARGEPLGPLHGVPVTIKINVDYAGRATTNGVVAFKDRIAQTDSPPVANWRKAGAIIIGRTNVPPFSAGSLPTMRCMDAPAIRGMPAGRRADRAVGLRLRSRPV